MREAPKTAATQCHPLLTRPKLPPAPYTEKKNANLFQKIHIIYAIILLKQSRVPVATKKYFPQKKWFKKKQLNCFLFFGVRLLHSPGKQLCKFVVHRRWRSFHQNSKPVCHNAAMVPAIKAKLNNNRKQRHLEQEQQKRPPHKHRQLPPADEDEDVEQIQLRWPANLAFPPALPHRTMPSHYRHRNDEIPCINLACGVS